MKLEMILILIFVEEIINVSIILFFYYLLNIHIEQEVKNGQQCKKQRSALKRK